MDRRRNWIVGAVLFLITLVLYWPATFFPFVNFDDPAYTTANPEVLNGLNWAGIKWAVTCIEPANWQPLTLMSHMADCSLYGVFAGGHHLTSILLHATNAVLLWLLFARMTGWFWPSALMAALFAWHPLNVESVAWVAERKNVLSTFFFILTVWAYWRYAMTAPRSKWFHYILALVLFAGGLAAKSMLVTLPFLLLLLDGWPLRRYSLASSLGEIIRNKQTRALVLEKLPFLACSLADCVITYLSQNHAGGVRSLTLVPVEFRLLNVPVAYLMYLAKTLWPLKLCALYPFPETPPVLAGISSWLLLLAATLMVWRGRDKFPWLPVGWFWFLGTLVPVIGLVQVGAQAIADRYTYLPLIGLFLIIAGGLNESLSIWPQMRAVAEMGAAIFLAACLGLTGRQLLTWQDSVALFQQVVAVNPNNAMAQNLMGRAYAGNGQTEKAIDCYAAAVRLHPDVATAQYDLGSELICAGRFEEAETALTKALMMLPNDESLHNLRGVALMQAHRPAEAKKEFFRAIELQPDSAGPHFNLGKALLAEGDYPAATNQFDTAEKLQPARTDQIAAELKTYQRTTTTQSSVPSKK